jgi:AmmeMemoRadiSam system protein A
MYAGGAGLSTGAWGGILSLVQYRFRPFYWSPESEPDMSDPVTPSPTWPSFARQVIEAAIRNADVMGAQPPAHSVPAFGGVFVTLKKLGRLRGCMGTLDASQPLAEAVRHAAQTTALSDPRFPPVALAELPDVSVEVSILSKPWPMRTLDDLQIGTHGIIVHKGLQRGLFLPQVAREHGLDKNTFLSRCCAEKAGLAPDAWQDPDTEVLLFTADIFSE